MMTSNGNNVDQPKIDIFINTLEVRDYSNDPTFIKRAQEAKEFMEKVGFPEELLKIREAMYGKYINKGLLTEPFPLNSLPPIQPI